MSSSLGVGVPLVSFGGDTSAKSNQTAAVNRMVCNAAVYSLKEHGGCGVVFLADTNQGRSGERLTDKVPLCACQFV